ncbi:MAG: saccharopine dehydrogenase NADP-binding domain-containing protein [Prevotellaceae bacterium]|jgi:shikimate dehydrogenase|nr:saccharopine dehydrogenase NADP-binding domain-containing protein [Prevotellaceae bacterium]
MKRFALVGKPISHSKSPALFKAAYGDCDFEYSLIETTDVKYVENLLRNKVLYGVNVTIPIKIEALAIVDEIDETAEMTGATNAIVLCDNDKLKAYNTDYLGVLQTLIDFNVDVNGEECLIIGAGGAGRAVAFALHKLGANITIANRTSDKANRIAEKINCNIISMDEINDNIQNKKLIVNALPADVCIIDEQYLNYRQIVFDASPHQSALLKAAQSKGCKCIDGRFWLLYQGVAAYKIFTRQQPDINSMRKMLDI